MQLCTNCGFEVGGTLCGQSDPKGCAKAAADRVLPPLPVGPAERYVPRTYLSTSGGKWRVIHAGCSATPNFDTRERAEEAAKALRYTLPLPLYNGDLDLFDFERAAAEGSR
jgi:hypothetical protein